MAFIKALKKLVTVIWSDYQTNDLWQRIVKCTLATTAACVAVITPQALAVFGSATYLAPMVTVFGHPGQRMGLMIEALLMILIGSLLGLGWSLLGLYLSSLIVQENPPAAYTIRGLFLLVSVLFHGYVRSSSPRLFVFVAFLLIASIIVLLGEHTRASVSVFTMVYYPVLTGGAVAVVVNISMFPELSSNFLGVSTIDTLCETMDTLTRATHWFVTPGGDPEQPIDQTDELCATTTVKSSAEKPTSKRKKQTWWRKFLADFPNPFESSQSGFRASSIPIHETSVASLTSRKTKLRTRLARCKAAQKEVNYEFAVSPLPPGSMKPLSTSYMSNLVQSTVTLIGACENKFVVLENDDRSLDAKLTAVDSLSSAPITRLSTKEDYLMKLENAKPMRQIETSSAELLEMILALLREPVQEFEASLKVAVDLVVSCLAYCYDVPRLPSGMPAPKGIHLEELDMRIDHFTEALSLFDRRCAEQLHQSVMDESGHSIDFMPRMETFLVSSFLLAFRQSAMHVQDMLRHVRNVVEQRKARNDRYGIWVPRYTRIRKWLTTGGESDGMVLPTIARKEVRRGKPKPGSKSKSHDAPEGDEALISSKRDEEAGPGQHETEKPMSHRKVPRKTSKGQRTVDESDKQSWQLKLRGMAADALEWVQDSDDIAYALKLAFAIFFVSWPALITSWNPWYTGVRGIWAPMQLMLVFEVAIGTSFFIFLVRFSGVVFGCVVGYLSYEIGRGYRIPMVVILICGIAPSFYIQLGTKYVKAGMISTVSMVVVGLASINGSGLASENFYKRLSAFLIGGVVALIVELAIYPVRARHRLVESLSASVRQIQNMQAALAVGIDGPFHPDFRSPKLYRRFTEARSKARAALAAAETFLPFCSTEPRLKGSFKPLAPIYREIIYVLHQIIDRMENIVQLRREYGSSILENLNPEAHAYRRNALASLMLVLFLVNEALTTWQPLPQFIPSSRLAKIRLVNHVRNVLASSHTPGHDVAPIFDEDKPLDEQIANLVSQKRFLSWSASTAGQMEIIEYLEELVELVKLLVGVNAFRSGLLEKPDYGNYRQRMNMGKIPLANIPTVESAPTAPAEEIVTAPADIPGSSTRLRRHTTVKERVGQLRGRLRGKREEEAVVSESEDEDEVPMSLQRVGTRLWENNAVQRRRAFTLDHGPTGG